MIERVLYSILQGAYALGIGETKMRQLVKTGAIRTVRIGRARRITQAAIDEYVRGLEGKQAPRE